jgi:hypothetical protein
VELAGGLEVVLGENNQVDVPFRDQVGIGAIFYLHSSLPHDLASGFLHDEAGLFLVVSDPEYNPGRSAVYLVGPKD